MATQPTTNPPYTVNKQELGVRYNRDGTHEHTWTVHVTHADGTEGHVELPDTHYTAENVHAQIMHQNKAVMAVATLPASIEGSGASGSSSK